MGRLTTHILDVERGRPAAKVAIEAFAIEGETARKVGAAATNTDGRTDAPLIEGAAFAAGVYELRFDVGPYLAATGRAQPGFLDIVVLRFSVADPSEHYHVPLLLQAHGYATYRGS
ncbi:hydroxyisourate hydrolase [Hansschlegelia quercus]|uniref:5-hydroxyisourate hydrolase n=1 Tax=Hansschlegelia quercus TaxID=2528245 RepID=A0A4Q9GNN2_9HYPH|nr:hydroxyisourate hydrolase [Hansschlegelia quercus]TBN54795.1 hydroxyisourate hydrolase [Hansschlegelia quercus]